VRDQELTERCNIGYTIATLKLGLCCFKDIVELGRKHDVAPCFELASHERLLAIELNIKPSDEGKKYEKEMRVLTLPLAKSTRTSSARMIVTSALGVAFPLYTVPVFFASMAQVAVFPSLVTWNSKMPLV
jgi:hypothetical protein